MIISLLIKNDSKHGKEILTKRNENQIEIKINRIKLIEKSIRNY